MKLTRRCFSLSRMTHPDKSLDGMLASFLPMHRFYLHTEILFVRITLHVSRVAARPSTRVAVLTTDVRSCGRNSQRPWLLRKLKSDKFLVSRNACFESAKNDFVIVRLFFQHSGPFDDPDVILRPLTAATSDEEVVDSRHNLRDGRSVPRVQRRHDRRNLGHRRP